MDDICLLKDIQEYLFEMYFLYFYKWFQQMFFLLEKFLLIVLILIGDNDCDEEKVVGCVLVFWFMDEENVFIISFDFCYWGLYFSYFFYFQIFQLDRFLLLDLYGCVLFGFLIYKIIEVIDKVVMDVVESGSYDVFYDNFKLMKNIVCGCYFIGVMMVVLEVF